MQFHKLIAPLSSEIFDFMPYADAHSNTAHIKYVEKSDD